MKVLHKTILEYFVKLTFIFFIVYSVAYKGAPVPIVKVQSLTPSNELSTFKPVDSDYEPEYYEEFELVK